MPFCCSDSTYGVGAVKFDGDNRNVRAPGSSPILRGVTNGRAGVFLPSGGVSPPPRGVSAERRGGFPPPNGGAIPSAAGCPLRPAGFPFHGAGSPLPPPGCPLEPPGCPVRGAGTSLREMGAAFRSGKPLFLARNGLPDGKTASPALGGGHFKPPTAPSRLGLQLREEDHVADAFLAGGAP